MGIADRLALPDAEAWRPEVGDQVIGKVVDIGEREGDWGPYPVFTLASADGELVAVHAFHGVLRNELGTVQVGDEVGIAYKGMKEGAKQSYENYKVVIERNGAPVAAAAAAATQSELAEAGAEAKSGPTPGFVPPGPEDEEPF